MAKKVLRPPFGWMGGKATITAWLKQFLVPHRIYVEPFGGAMALLLTKDPSPVEVYNDVNSGLVTFYRVLRSKKGFEELHRLVELTPFSRREFERAKAMWPKMKDPVRRAYFWYLTAAMSFGGHFGQSWALTRTSARGMCSTVSSQLKRLDRLPLIHERLRRVSIEYGPWQRVLDTYDTSETFFYCDPPFLPETRSGGAYPDEMTREDHEELVARLLEVKGEVMVGNYPNDLYATLEEHGWSKHTKMRTCSVAGRTRGTDLHGKGKIKKTQKRVEVVWTSPGCGWEPTCI